MREGKKLNTKAIISFNIYKNIIQKLLKASINDVQVPIVDHLELLGVTIDNSLNFSEHIGKITKKVGKTLDVLSRLKNMLSIPSKMCLYNSYVMSYFTY